MEVATRILLIEDDVMLAEAVRTGLEQQEWRVDWLADAASARLALMDHGYTAILLDLGLPRGNGLDLLKFVRSRYDTTPVLILTARDKLSERISGLDAGADDYLVKPFQLDELAARVRAVLRRCQGRVLPVLAHRDVVIDLAKRIVTRGGESVTLGMHEYRTLLTLMENRGRALSRSQLEDAVYGGDGTIESNTIAVYIHQLRRKLGDDFINTVHGYGYRVGGADE
jgi:two-component system, OmpR family, response regulator